MPELCKITKLNSETGLLLLLSRMSPEPEVLERAQALIDAGIVWALLFSLSATHGTFGLVYKNLNRLKRVPGDVLERFENAYNTTRRHNILNVSEHDRIRDGLWGIGIEAISLKGPTASERIFGDIGLYPSADIDILVKVGDVDRVKAFLESDGYRLTDKGFDQYRDFFIRELYHVSFSKGGYVVEPHWNLFFRYFATPPEFWWEKRKIADAVGRPCSFLSPEREILYNSFRVFSKAYRPLRFLVMVAELIRHHHGEIDWEEMFVYAKRYKFENVLRIVLMMAVRLLGAPVSEPYAKVRGLRGRLLYKASVSMLFSEAGPYTADKMVLAFMRDDLAGSFKVLYRRIFPSMGEIVSRYRISSGTGKAFLYYAGNPLFIILRRRREIMMSARNGRRDL